jgi:phosphatidylglycerol lysyltransferase
LSNGRDRITLGKLTGEPRERAAARDIVDKYGRSSLDFFKLWPEKSYFFAEDNTCVIAYKTALCVAISLGDPVGPDDRLEQCIREFMRFSSQKRWTVAFHQALADLLPIYRKLGLRVIKFGEEAVVDVAHFCSVTAETKFFRYIRHRFEREGYTFARHVPPHPERLLEEAKEVSDSWLTLPGKLEYGFALGWFDRAYLSEVPLDVIRDSTGSLIAFANEVPDYRQGEVELDMMRHRVKAPNSAMEYLISMMLFDLNARGYAHLSLGLVPFAGVGSHAGANLEEKLVHLLFEHADRFFSFKGLYGFKNKFEPVWENRFLVYQGGLVGFARTLLAEMRVTEVAR